MAERTIDEVLLAVTEAFDNAVEHGGAGSRGVRVLAAVRPRRVLLRVIGGSAARLPSLLRGLETSDRFPPGDGERGRGLFLVRAYVDRVDVKESDGEIEVRMTKRRRAP